MAITVSDLRALFARSGNRCAFPGCQEALVADDNLFIGQICHIEAASPDGPRYNSIQPMDERHGYKNLLLLCYPHHRRIDSEPQTYSVDWLKATKEAHESLFVDRLFTVRQEFLDAVLVETEAYWRQLAAVQNLAATLHEFPMQVKAEASHTEVIGTLRDILQDVEVLVTRLAESERSSAQGPSPWESTHIYLPNLLRLAAMHIWQLEVHYLAAHVRLSPDDHDAAARLHRAKAELVHLSKVSGYVD